MSRSERTGLADAVALDTQSQQAPDYQAPMILESVTQHLVDSSDTEARFVCPFCGAAYPASRQLCSRCDGNLVVPISNSEVYETIVPMCGLDCRPRNRDSQSSAS